MSDRDIALAPDGLANPDWVAAQAAAPSPLALQVTTVEAQLSPDELRRRRVELALASKLLNAHLRNRRQLMQSDPADLTGLPPAQTMLLIRAMIAAAHADGVLGREERERLVELVRSAIEGATGRDALLSEMEAPPSVEQLTRSVESPALAERFYAVSVAVAGFDHPANRTYLAYLAARLNIPADVVLRINRERTGARTRVRGLPG
jgi:uncharacterized membrane protein YebE (DUF533 family)